MKENPMDKVMAGITERVGKVEQKLTNDFKNVKPFNKQVLSESDLLRHYDSLTPDSMNYLLNKHGAEKVRQFVLEMEELRRKKQGYA